LHLFPVGESGWTPKVLTCSAIENKGLKEIWQKIIEYRNFTEQNGYFHNRRKMQSLYWMNETIEESLRNRFYNNKEIKQKLHQFKQEVLEDKTSSFLAAQQIINYYFGKKV
jgi:LAO/AO transport system kinase